ncbi:hypothetical protein AVL62_05930 [Serinicoccus chungangensis]|uniref:Uncharacterized protein n=1 Tax=Serinicoccus chungangensis TaxID=767452 RepID=A0A0W8IH13_9MICO|nr:hypothetical protein AVL62_05930 [Serinicoccus chungangensis]
MTARVKHNERRRRNRELKAQIVAAAGEMGHGSEVLAWLRQGPPARAKEWAKGHGLPQGCTRGRVTPPAKGP